MVRRPVKLSCTNRGLLAHAQKSQNFFGPQMGPEIRRALAQGVSDHRLCNSNKSWNRNRTITFEHQIKQKLEHNLNSNSSFCNRCCSCCCCCSNCCFCCWKCAREAAFPGASAHGNRVLFDFESSYLLSIFRTPFSTQIINTVCDKSDTGIYSFCNRWEAFFKNKCENKQVRFDCTGAYGLNMSLSLGTFRATKKLKRK